MLINEGDKIQNYRDSRILEKIRSMEIKYPHVKMGIKITNRRLRNSFK
jgi:hypothetical protein